ncbi:MAG: S24/S26 family peptidase [Clostridia bacterium]|nr:S24/S26 family peptidase [Clostridia bacterium]
MEEYLKENGIYVGLTRGISMRPMLREGRDTILISPVSGRLKKYDVPLYRRGEDYVLHRVVKVREQDYVICGDNCLRREYGITDEQLVGVLSGFRRGDRYVEIDSMCYRLYARVWVAIYPMRFVFMYLKMIAKGCIRRVLKK